MGQVKILRSSTFPTPFTYKYSLCRPLSEMEFALVFLSWKKEMGLINTTILTIHNSSNNILYSLIRHVQ